MVPSHPSLGSCYLQQLFVPLFGEKSMPGALFSTSVLRAICFIRFTLKPITALVQAMSSSACLSSWAFVAVLSDCPSPEVLEMYVDSIQ